jgi:hypothetical protein
MPVAIISTFRLPHSGHTSRARHSRTVANHIAKKDPKHGGVVMLLAAGPPPADGRESARSSRETAMISRERPHRPFLSRRDREFVHEPICGADDELVGDLEQSNVNSRVAGASHRGPARRWRTQCCGVTRAAALRDLHPQGSPAYEYPTPGSPVYGDTKATQDTPFSPDRRAMNTKATQGYPLSPLPRAKDI